MDTSTVQSSTGKLVSKSSVDATRATANLAKHARLILDEMFIPLNEDQCRKHIQMDPYKGVTLHGSETIPCLGESRIEILSRFRDKASAKNFVHIMPDTLLRLDLNFANLSGITMEEASVMKELDRTLTAVAASKPFYHQTCFAHALHLAVIDSLRAVTRFEGELDFDWAFVADTTPKADEQGRKSHCPITWDGVFCWNSVPASSVAARSCRSLLENEVGYKPPETHPDSLWQDRYAIRICAPNGQWDSQTNYNACLEQIPNQDASYSVVPMAVTYLILIFSFISLIFLLASAFIFIYFRTLKCSRTKVHLNLVTSLIIHSVMLIAISGPLILDQTWGRDDTGHKHFIKKNPMLCKAILCLQMYSSMSSINWMFVEGLLLHSKITTSIFRKSAPFKLYYMLGWGLPLLFIIPWALEMEATNTPGSCWEGYVQSDWTWLLIAPRLTAVLVNFCFLVNIVRILVSRVKSAENTQFRKGMKATLLLFPLLGITHLFFCFNPQDADRKLKDVYMITNAILMSSQGIFVSTIYCFMNSDVQTSLRNAYLRATIRRNPNRRRKTHCENSLLFGSQVRTGELRQTRSFSKVKDGNLSISTKGRGPEVLRMASPTRVVVMPDNLQ